MKRKIIQTAPSLLNAVQFGQRGADAKEEVAVPEHLTVDHQRDIKVAHAGQCRAASE